MKKMLLHCACDSLSIAILIEYIEETDENLSSIDLSAEEQWLIVKKVF